MLEAHRWRLWIENMQPPEEATTPLSFRSTPSGAAPRRRPPLQPRIFGFLSWSAASALLSIATSPSKEPPVHGNGREEAPFTAGASRPAPSEATLALELGALRAGDLNVGHTAACGSAVHAAVNPRYGEISDMGRYGEIWGDMGRSREISGDIGRYPVAWDARDMGRYGGDMERYGYAAPGMPDGP